MTRNLRDPDALLASQVDPTNRQLIESLSDVWRGFVKPLFFEVSADYTTTAKAAHESVATSGSSDITVSLSREHTDGDRVTVIWNGSGDVSIDTEGSESIMGGNTYALFSKLHNLTLYKQTDWFIEAEVKDEPQNPLLEAIVDENGEAITDENGEVIVG